MAGNLYNTRRRLAIAIESTEGTDAIGSPPGASSFAYIEELEVAPNQEKQDLPGNSAGAPGFGKVTARTNQAGSFMTVTQMNDISVADGSDAPPNNTDVIYRMSGAVRTGDAGTQSYTYGWGYIQGESATLKRYKINSDNTAMRENVALSCRANLTIEAPNPGALIRSSVEYMGVPGNIPPEVEVSTPAVTGVQYPPQDAFKLIGATVKIARLDTYAVYGGGTALAPDCDVELQGFNISLNYAAQTRSGACATSGIAGTVFGYEQGTAEITVEATDLSAWDWFEINDLAIPVEVNITVPEPGNANNTMQIVFYGVINDNISSNEISEGRLIETIPLDLVYPTDYASVPAAGSDSQPIIQAPSGGAEEGLGLGENVTIDPSILAVQFVTA